MASTRVLSLILLCTISVSCCTWAEGASHRHASAPAPSVDCTNLVLNMADCLAFVSNDSTSTKPEGTCCSGLKTVLSTDAECLCEAFKSSVQFGIVLNITKALSLPSACKIHAPPASNCGLTTTASPTGAPESAAGLSVNGVSPLNVLEGYAHVNQAFLNIEMPKQKVDINVEEVRDLPRE